MKKYLISLVAVLFALSTMIMYVSANHDGEAIRIGSKDFTENLLVAEIYALALEAEGFEVDVFQPFQVRSSTPQLLTMKLTCTRNIPELAY